MSIDWGVVERAAWIATIIAALVAVVFGTPYLKRRRRAASGRAYERTKRAVEVLGQDYLSKAAAQGSQWSDTAPVIDRAESSLDRVSVEGGRAVRKKADELRDRLLGTRNLAFAIVGHIQSASTKQEIALKKYVALYQELEDALEEFKKAARW